ncbi:hypothetical protein OXPF_38490 [Oxobacter pfennigii]|uniref:Uncharacterized protein n=1 Tax=Oxobacter pfennigii TaxID=36849 RepID=A0A0N8NSQ3_9CLOT|nr:hypothetical protein [Oxobacter pfennigii]KPU42672.1 hypothetical protein OXPF_38490 [Oxobacter pfennigii]
MSDYRLEFGTPSGPNDTDRLHSLLSVVTHEDDLAITMNNDKEQIEHIVDVLKDNEFEIKTKSNNTEDKFHIHARRKA